jgi:prepilin-type N-terminal cleavage/methylation domain-containing protein
MASGRGHTGRGFTLIESLLAAVVLAGAICAVTLPFSTSARNRQVEARISVAVPMAEELMEEILAQNFLDENPAFARHLGPEPGETQRGALDNVDDYDGYAEASGCVTDIEGRPEETPDAWGLSRTATVEYVYVAGQDTALPPSFARVTVQVLYDGQTVVSLTRLVYNTPEG